MVDVNNILDRYKDIERKVSQAKDGLSKLTAERDFAIVRVNESISEFNTAHGTDLKNIADVENHLAEINKSIEDSVSEFNKLVAEFNQEWNGGSNAN